MATKRSTVLGVLAFGVLGTLVFMSCVTRSVKSSAEYVHALAFCARAPAVVADLGEPIEDGFLPSVKYPTTAKATANVGVTLTGPRGKGTVYLTEIHDTRGWRVIGASWTYRGATKDLGGEAAR